MNYYQKEYIRRINLVYDYVDTHLYEELSVEVLSGIAGLSPYHFHRIFSAMTGESLAQFVRRLRLEKAAVMLLQDLDEPVSRIAYDCGFKSSSVFCRNFKERFGLSAQEFRSSYEKESKNRQLHSTKNQFNQEMVDYVCNSETVKQRQMIERKPIEVKDMPEMHVVYFRHQGAFDQIKYAYEKLFRWAGPRGLIGEGSKTITVYHDNPEVTEIDKVRQSAGLVVDASVKPEGEFGKMTVPAGKYIVGAFEISVDEFKKAWDAVCVALTESGYQPADAFPYELYHADPDQHPENKFVLDICIPVKPM